MTEPTDAQREEFWEWCRFTIGEYADEWVSPDYTCFDGFPPINFINLFKYAVPLAVQNIAARQQCSEHIAFLILLGKWADKCMKENRTILDINPDALFWALWPIISDKEEKE